MGLAQPKITRDRFNPGYVGTEVDAALNCRQAKHTSDTFHDQCEIRKKQDILTEKRENGMALVKWNFLPESDNVDA